MFTAATATRRLTVTLIIAAVLAVTAGGIMLGRYILDDPMCARPPTPPRRVQLQAFVTAHLPDARNFDWTVSDCDENGQAYLDFTTRSTGHAASKAFLADPACATSREPDAEAGDVTCSANTTQISIYLEDTGAIDTDVELAIDQH